jgi:hypothetical protein
MDEHEITFHSNAEGVKAFQAAIDEYVESSKPKDEGLIERLTREMKEISQEEWTSIKGKGLFAQMNDESLKYAKMSEEVQNAVKEMPTGDWVLDEEKRAFQGILDQVTEHSKEMFPEYLDESMNDITQLEITPKALLDLGFEEQYQREEGGAVGYIYYTLHLLGMELCSSVVGDDEPFHVVAGDEGEFIIHNLRKLGDLILSLKELS